MGKNVIIFGADISSFAHFDNKAKDILIFIKVPTQGLGDMTLPAEVIYPVNHTQPNKRFVFSLHCSGSNSFLFVNEKNISVQSKKIWNKRLCTVFR